MIGLERKSFISRKQSTCLITQYAYINIQIAIFVFLSFFLGGGGGKKIIDTFFYKLYLCIITYVAIFPNKISFLPRSF